MPARAVSRRAQAGALSVKLLLPLLLTALLYMGSVSLPFFSDDVETQRFVQPRTLFELWTQVEVNGTYYRPLTNLLHRAVPLEAALWHALLLWLHLATVAFVGALARALLGRAAAAWAMLLYAAFPFHAQAVLWPAAIVHLLVTLLIAAACVGALTGRRWLALGAGTAAPFAHESGVVAFALLGLMLWAQRGAKGLERNWQGTAALLGTVGGGALLCWAIRSRFVVGSAPTVDWESLAFNAAYLGQGLSWPMQWAAGALPIDPVTRALGALGACLALMTAALHRQRTLWAGLGWIGTALTPALLLLHPNYVLYGDRLLMIAAPAVALLWAALLGRLPRLLRASVLIAWALGGLLLTREVVAQHHLHADALRSVIATADPDTPTLYLNLPSHTEQRSSPLPLWRASASLLTDWIRLEDFLWLNAGQREFPQVTYAHAAWLAAAPNGLLTHFYGRSITPDELMPMVRGHARTFLTRWDGGWRLTEWARRLEGVEGGVLDGSVRLAVDAYVEGETVVVMLDWQRVSAMSAKWTAFVHLLCDGEWLAQADGDPFANSYPLSAWAVGEAWREARWMPRPPVDRACLRVEAGLYDRTTLQRAATAAGEDALSAAVR